MAIRKIHRTPLRRNNDVVNINNEQREENYTNNIRLANTDIQHEELNHTEIVRILENQVQESNSNEADEIIKINGKLGISLRKGTMYYDEGNTARLLKLINVERNIDNNKVIFTITSMYMGNEIKMRIPREEALQRKGIIKLSSEGAHINEVNAKYHIDALEYQEETIGKINNVHKEIGYFEHEGNEIFKLHKGINIDSNYDGNLNIEPKGNLGDYLEDIKNYVAPYPSMSLAWVLGATSAIVAKLNKLNVDVNTLLVHLVAESSKGKSTATMLAISVWGDPKLGVGGLYNTWNATENALITSLTGNHGVAYALDELSMTKIENLTSLIYNIVGGKDKTRLTKEIEMRKSGTWITTVISNGETSILSKANNNTGLDIRVLELDNIPWTASSKHSEEVKKLTTRNYGVFGNSFAEKLVKFSKEKLIKLFEEQRQIFIDKLNEIGITDNKIQRTSSKYAIVILTAKLINVGYNNYGISLDIDGITEILINTEIESIKKRGLEKKAEDWLLQVVESNASKFKSVSDDKSNVDCWGSIKTLPNGEIEVAILRNKFHEIMKQGKFEDPKVVIKQLKEDGKLDHEKDRDTRKRIINTITTPVYVIRLNQ